MANSKCVHPMVSAFSSLCSPYGELSKLAIILWGAKKQFNVCILAPQPFLNSFLPSLGPGLFLANATESLNGLPSPSPSPLSLSSPLPVSSLSLTRQLSSRKGLRMAMCWPVRLEAGSTPRTICQTVSCGEGGERSYANIGRNIALSFKGYLPRPWNGICFINT